MKKYFILLVALMGMVSINAQDSNVQDVANKVDNAVARANNFANTTANFADNMDDALVKILNGAMSMAEKTGEFVIEQGGDILRQFFIWHMVKLLFVIAVAIALLFIGYKVFFALKKGGYDESPDGEYYSSDYSKVFGKYKHDGEITARCVIGIGTFVIGIIVFFNNIFDLIQIVFAPKLYLIEYVIDLTK